MTQVSRDEWDKHWSELDDITMINPAQHYRQRMLTKILSNLLKSEKNELKNILDFGSGQGDLVKVLFSCFSNHSFFGLELSMVGVGIALRKVPGVDFRQCNLLEDSPAHDDLYGMANIGICSEVLEHIDEPRIILKNIRKYLASPGYLIVTVPCGPMNWFEKSIGHRKHYRPEDLEVLLNESGFKTREIYRSGFPFFNLYKIIAFMRGKKICDDARGNSDKPSGFMITTLKIFDFLFEYFNFDRTPWGWQLIAVAEKNASLNNNVENG